MITKDFLVSLPHSKRRAESAVGNKSCRKYIVLHLVANYDRWNPRTQEDDTLILIGATLTIYGDPENVIYKRSSLQI